MLINGNINDSPHAPRRGSIIEGDKVRKKKKTSEKSLVEAVLMMTMTDNDNDAVCVYNECVDGHDG